MASWRCNLVLLVFVVNGTLQSQIFLLQSQTTALENNTITLTCFNKTGTLEVSRWLSSMFPGKVAVCGRLGETCIKTNFLNTSLYDCTCNDNRTISVYLRHVDRRQHKAIWSCEAVGGVKSNDVLIDVSVPVTQVVLHQSDSSPVIENSRTTFQFNTSYSLPAATIDWYRSKDASIEKIIHNFDRDVHIATKTYARDDNVISVEETLTYKVNRSVHGWSVYCNASNFGNHQVTSNRIMLFVIFKTVIKRFIFIGYEGQQSVIVNENQSVQFQCDIDSTSGSTIKMYFEGQKEIHTVLDVNSLSFSLENVTCSQAGFYVCTAINDVYNDQPSIAALLLYVRCPPKRSSDGVITKVYARPNDSATFSFTALAYPEPGPSGFSWYKQKGSKWNLLTQSTNNYIFLSNLQTNFTIKAVTDVDYGEYMVRITNFLGKHEETFSLLKVAEDSPDRCDDNSARVVYIVLGCLLTLVVIIDVTVLIIFKHRRYRMKKADGTKKTDVSSYDEMQTISDKRPADNTEHSYEQLTQDARGSTNTVYTNLTV